MERTINAESGNKERNSDLKDIFKGGEILKSEMKDLSWMDASEQNATLCHAHVSRQQRGTSGP